MFKRYFYFHRTFLLLFFFLISHFIVLAQIKQGTFRIGPEIAFNTFEERLAGEAPEYNSSTLLFCASLGYYVLNNFEVGIKTSQYLKKEEADLDESKFYESFNGLNATYMITGTEKFYVPLSFTIGLIGTKFTPDNNDEIRFQGNGFAFGTGMEYLLSNRLAARLSLEHRSFKLDEKDDEIIEEYLRELEWKTFVMTVGVNFYFEKKQSKKTKDLTNY